jgi:hypothetical protein
MLDLDEKANPSLFIVEVDSIYSFISAVPYQVKDDIINAQKWVFLKPKCDWYDIFINFIKETLSNYKKNQPKNLVETKKRKKN